MSYRARCEGRRHRRQWVAYGRMRRAHERSFHALDSLRPPEMGTGDPLVDAMAREMFGAAQQFARSVQMHCYGPRFQTWTERYRASKEARHGR